MKKGFTLLEIIVAVGIISLIGAASMVSFLNSRRTRDLGTSGQNVLSILRLAQSKTIAGEDASNWGVHLDSSQFVLFRGATYAGATKTEPHALPDTLEIANISLAGGGSDIIFQKIYGTTIQSGTIDIRVKAVATQKFSITIDSSGKVYQTETPPASLNTRITDARHRAFNLGWSIQDSLTLTLTFSDTPNPDVIFPVVITPVPPRTTFDWSGSVAVGGQNQILRLHATSITVSNTILHVDRDCRYNTKKVKITIDTRDIATYEANCQTITAGAFGGTVSEP